MTALVATDIAAIFFIHMAYWVGFYMGRKS